jgi:hypothetical protein
MINQTAFQIGAFLMLASLIFTLTMWILAAVNRLRIESVGIFNNPYTHLYKVEIKSIQVILGWLPLGCFVKIAGMSDENLDQENSSSTSDIPAYEFRGRPLGTKILVIMTSPLLLTVIGLILLNTTSFPLLELLTTYLKIAFFQLPLEAGAPIWEAFYTNSIFLVGSIFIFLGIGNIGTNLGCLINEDNNNLTWLLFFLPLFFLFLSLGFFRLIWSTFAWANLFYFLLGCLLMGLIGFLLALLLAKLLPNN